MVKRWFAAKRYGYGWYPVTWQGWAVTIGYVVLLLVPTAGASFAGFKDIRETTFAWLFINYALALTGILLFVCWKTGEPARWRWGGK
jgi:hypothetical protein